MSEIAVTVTVNGERRTALAEPRRTLVDFLREDLLLTGTHVGCEHGVCGACTVLVDGEPVRACLMLAVQASGHEVRTLEGAGDDPVGAVVQEALRESHAFQCGFCTPGFVTTIQALLAESDGPLSRERIRRHLSGNLCRCSGYQPIVDAVESAAGKLAAAPPVDARGGDGAVR
jgi:aerobic-type carbon monoxide dehydrogenase small subunit (CoxS/CutS family)